MNIYFYQLLIVAGIHALAVISPGPDFLIVIKLSLSHGRKIGILSAIGVAFGISVHIAYSILGIGALISSSILLFSIIKILGALYLIYIGLISFRGSFINSKLIKKGNVDYEPIMSEKEHMNIRSALKIGFLTNVLNPKATLFILAVFTQVITPATPKYIQLIYGVEMIVATAIWFSIVALFLSTPIVSRKINTIKHIVDRVTGVALTALGIKILLE